MRYAWLHILLVLGLTLNNCKTQVKVPAAPTLKDSVYTFGNPSPDGIGKFYKDRQIAHIMGAAGSEWLERTERQKEENAMLAIQNMNLKPDEVVADIGAGTGYFTFKIAPLIPAGKIYAEDVQDEMISFLNQKKTALALKNVEVVSGTDQSPNLPDNAIDLAFMVDVYHELEYPHEMLQAIKKSLKPGGKLLLIEYRGEDDSIAILPLHKTTIKQLDIELKANGFVRDSTGKFLPIQHFAVYKKG
jgi:precorrin-6B methylase 2